MEVARYEAVETLRDGRQFRVRALKPDDRAGLLSAVSQSSAQSMYRRFFSPKRSFTEDEVAYFMDVDFVGHVALVAELEEDGREVIIGGGRYVLSRTGQGRDGFRGCRPLPGTRRRNSPHAPSRGNCPSRRT